MQQKTALTLIDHIVVNVNNLDESIRWYTSSFLCEVIYQTKTLAVLNFKNLKLVLSLPSEQRGHIAYHKADSASFGEIREQSDLCLSTFISDPSGNPIELVKSTIEENSKIRN